MQQDSVNIQSKGVDTFSGNKKISLRKVNGDTTGHPIQTDTLIIKDSLSSIKLNNSKALIKGKLKGYSDHQVIQLEITKGSLLNVWIQPEFGSGNVRVNQIQLPDGRFDGPLGNKIKYPVSDHGIYRLIIGENQMAEGNWKGYYILKIEVE